MKPIEGMNVAAARGVIRLEIRRHVLAELQNLASFGWLGMSAGDIHGKMSVISDMSIYFSESFYRYIFSSRESDDFAPIWYALTALGVPGGMIDIDIVGGRCTVNLVKKGRADIRLASMGDHHGRITGQVFMVRSPAAVAELRVNEWLPLKSEAGAEFKRQIIMELLNGKNTEIFC